MSGYDNYYGSLKDPTEKHEVERRGIRRYVKSSVLLAPMQRWKPDKFWEFTTDTRITEYTNMSGKGWVALRGLKGPTKKQSFYAYENVESLEAEIRAAGIRHESE